MPEPGQRPEGTSGLKTTAGAVGTQRGRFRRVAKAKAVTHGYVAPDIAERIFRDTLAAWGMTSSSEEMRDEVLYGLSEVLWASTSVETDYSQVTFDVNGTVCSVGALVSACAAAISADNPLRVWIRSFRQAELAMRISDFLDTPENVSQRQEAVASYGADVKDARFCFDMADALLVSGRTFTGSERLTINSLKIYATSRAQSSAQSRGLMQPQQDSSGGKAGGVRADMHTTPAPTVPTPTRVGFSSVR